MARALYFNGVQFGDGIVQVEPECAPQSPIAVQAGIGQARAQVVAESVNQLYAMTWFVHIKKNSDYELGLYIANLQQYVNVQGLVEDKEGSTVRIRGRDWWLARAPRLSVAPGYGGRFTPSWELTFYGQTPPEAGS